MALAADLSDTKLWNSPTIFAMYASRSAFMAFHCALVIGSLYGFGTLGLGPANAVAAAAAEEECAAEEEDWAACEDWAAIEDWAALEDCMAEVLTVVVGGWVVGSGEVVSDETEAFETMLIA